MANYNYIVNDVETTGLSPDEGHEIVQLSAYALVGSSLADHPSGTFNILIKPQRPEKASKGALNVIGPLFDRAMKDGLHPKVALQRYAEWVSTVSSGKSKYDRPVMAGHNCKFDFNFILKQMMEYKICTGEDTFPFSHKFLCTAQMAHMYFGHLPYVKNDTLNVILELVGERRANADIHDAQEDVLLTTNLFKRFMKFSRFAQTKMQINRPSESVTA